MNLYLVYEAGYSDEVSTGLRQATITHGISFQARFPPGIMDRLFQRYQAG